MENYKINRENKTFVFDDGTELPIPKDKVNQVLRTPYAQKLKEEVKSKAKKSYETSIFPKSVSAGVGSALESFLGNASATEREYLTSGIKGISSREGQENLGYLDRVLDNFYAMQEGRKEAQQEISQQHPIASKVGTGVGILGELLALRKVPATVALPVMGAAHSEKSFLEPSEKIPEVASEATIGFLMDKFFGGLNKIAGHRETRKGVQNAIKSVEEGNAAEIQRVAQANEAEAARFATENATREAELGRIPALQQAENAAFAQSSAEKIGRIAQTLGKTPLAVEAIGVEPFIEQFVETGVHAASKEGNAVSKFLRTVFKGKNGKMDSQSLQNGMKAVDEKIASESGPVRDLLTQFKTTLSQELPTKIGSYFAFEKWIPKIQTRLFPALEKDLITTFEKNPEMFGYIKDKAGSKILTEANKSIRQDIEKVFNSHAGNIENSIRDGSLAQDIRAAIESNPQYQQITDTIMNFSPTLPKNMRGKIPINWPKPKGYEILKEDLISLPERISERVGQVSERYLPDITADIATKNDITQKALSKIPTSPRIIPEPSPINPAQVAQPQLKTPPTIPEPRGIYERIAHGLEKITGKGVSEVAKQAKENAPLALIAKLGGIPVGSAIAAGAAGIGVANALTHPSIAGQAGRAILQQTARSVDSAQQRAEKYPSHKGVGVLENPLERRSLVKEIEDDYGMSLEDKALIQSKINRGQPLIADFAK